VLAISLAMLPIACGAQVANLLCSSRGALDKVVALDYAKKLANDWPAVFTDSEIKWVSIDVREGVVKYADHTVNRLSGTYQFWTRGAIYASAPPVYSCVKAPQQRF
jgi:hypothetical protein